MTRESIIEKYFEALKDLKMQIHHFPKISISGFCRAKDLNRNAACFIVKLGIVKNEGGRGGNANFFWNTIEPNKRMAIKLIEKCHAFEEEQKKSLLEEKKLITEEKSKVEVEKPIIRRNRISRSKISYSVTKYFFGLIKIKSEYFYK